MLHRVDHSTNLSLSLFSVLSVLLLSCVCSVVCHLAASFGPSCSALPASTVPAAWFCLFALLGMAAKCVRVVGTKFGYLRKRELSNEFFCKAVATLFSQANVSWICLKKGTNLFSRWVLAIKSRGRRV
eukprot:TRINITY_DN33974_c0_g1_i1.p1 TRINITY_DN33974_c0_g1~~TRINITY_DN33974_c0_g1_i1.p1  ORF type:complete len:128 (-),score=7.91 TRINITY_DN33974_c0_g1_i1:326-709(-)